MSRFFSLMVLTVFGALLCELPVTADEADRNSASPQTPPVLAENHPAQSAVQQAVAAFRSGDTQEAFNQLVAISKQHADLPPGEVMFAHLAFAAGQASAGRSALEQAVVQYPHDPEAWNMLGELAVRSGRLAEGDLLFRRAAQAVEQYPDNDTRKQKLQTTALAGLSAVFERRGQWKQAERQLRIWLAADNSSAAVRQRLAQVLFRQEQFEAARQMFEDARTLEQSQLPADVLMGQLYQQAGLFQEAAASMEQAAADHPDQMSVQLAVARWALTAGQQETLDAALETAAKLDPSSDLLKILTAMSRRFQQRSKEAEQIFRELLQDNPASFDASNGLALSLLEQDDTKKHQQALQYAQVNARSYQDLQTPRGRASAATYAWALHRVGKTAQAAQLIQKVLTSGNVSPEIGYISAVILSASDRAQDAVKLLEASLTSPAAFPQQDEARRLLAKLKS